MSQLQELDYQIEAIQAIVNVFKGVPLKKVNSNANLTFDLSDPFTKELITQNICEVQVEKEISMAMRSTRIREDDKVLGIDVKMETGTGKTYVYSRLMLELHKEYRFNKFIILTPTIPIKEGTKSFLISEEFKSHYRNYEEFSQVNLKLSVLDAQKPANKGRRYPPKSVSDFTDGDSYSKETIHCLLTGGGMLKEGKNSTLYRNDYDTVMLNGTYRPVDALSETRPIVIIDEPHKFDRNNKTWKFIIDYIKPQAIIRFGATFPLTQNKKRDYDNLVYDLNSQEAFNRDLVKGVSVYNPEFENKNKTRYTLVSVSSSRPRVAKFRNEYSKKEHIVGLNESLTILDQSFKGISIMNIGKQEELNNQIGIKLNNDKVLALRDALLPGVFSTSYQEMMIKQAIDLHFEKEIENFIEKSPRYKTLSLFFIDLRESYRKEDDTNGNLRDYFEKVLAHKLDKLILEFEGKKTLNNLEKEYVEYLKASLSNIKNTNGGYFSKDNSTSDDAIQEEVNEILRDKKKLLSFKDENGNWNVRRFIFSKWTLREGWDNPNIFTIAKLRSSGSDNSKIQEVGRGLRLPVNEFGVRATAGEESFFLNYLVDHTENEFANKLYAEINEGVEHFINIKSILDTVAAKLDLKPVKLAADLMTKEYIDENYNIVENKREEFYNEYPDFRVGVKGGKVTKGKPINIGIRKEQFNKIRKLWLGINKNYMIHLEGATNELLLSGIEKSLTGDIFTREYSNFRKKTVSSVNGEVKISDSYVGSFELFEAKLGYGDFLKKLSRRTSLPISLLHEGIVKFYKESGIDIYPTESTISKFVANFDDWFIKEFKTKYSYSLISDVKKQTALTNSEGEPLSSIKQADIGIYKSEGAIPSQFLYDHFVYDSPIEKENIEKSCIESIEVFGKIPRRSIRVPMFFGGTTSPDFMYVVTDAKGNPTLNLVIESKDVIKRSDLRGTELAKIEESQKFFEMLKAEGLNVKYTPQLKNDKILQVLSNIQKE